MLKRQIATLVIVTTAVFLGVWLSGAGLGNRPAAHPQSQIQKDAGNSQNSDKNDQQKGYYIKDYNGRVSVIREGEQVPDMIFNVFTRTLPELDQEQLLDGVYIESYEELVRRVEDYTS